MSTVPAVPAPGQDDAALLGQLEAMHDYLDEHGLGELHAAAEWTVRIARQADQLIALSGYLPFLDRLAVGFIDPEIDRGDPGFGLIAYLGPPRELLRSGEFADVDAHELAVEVDGQTFPLVVRYATYVEQVAMSVPAQATAAVWLRARRNTKTPKEGWLVPFHAVGSNNAAVQFADGTSGHVIDSFGRCMDATVVSSATGRPPGAQRIAALRVPAPGLAVDVTDRGGNRYSASIVDVDIDIGLIYYRKAPIRFTYDWSASAKSDSGALVKSGAGEPVGMHQGAAKIYDQWGVEVRDAAGVQVRRAFGLCLFQIETYGDAEVYV